MRGKEEGRNDTIDAFRGVAILSVLTFHYLVRWAPPYEPQNVYGYSGRYPSALAVGGLGVHLFFVISGLVITMTVVGSKDALDFAARRFARLYPAFLVGMVLTAAVCASADVWQFKIGLRDFFANLTMVPSDFKPPMKAADVAYWSLAIEVKFYAYVAISYWWFRDLFWIAIAALAIFGNIGAFIGHGGFCDHWMIAEYMPLFLLGMGMWFFEFGSRPREGLLLIVLGAVLYAARHSVFQPVGAPPWMAHLYLAGTISSLFLLLLFKPSWTLGPLPWIGRISYSLYLIHQNIGVIAIRELKRIGLPDIPAALLATVGCIAFATLMFNVIERPGKRLLMEAFHATGK